MGKGGRSAGLETIDEVPSPLTFDFVKDAPKNGNGEYEQLLAEKHIDILDENNETIIRVSPHRWWVLFVFGFAAVNQAMVWMILSPSSDEFEKAYGGTFDSTYINFATNVAFQHFHKRRCWSILIFSNIFKIYYNNIFLQTVFVGLSVILLK